MTYRRELNLNLALLVATLALAGCAGAPPKQEPIEEKFSSAEMDHDPNAGPAASSEGDLTPDQKAQMEIALRRGGDKAANCAAVVPDAPHGEGEVKVTFDGKKGRSVAAEVGPPWAGTSVESCIKRSFVGEIIVPFEGVLDVPYTVKLGGKADATKDAKDPKKK